MKQIYKKENRILLSMITGMIVISLLCGIQWRGSQKNVLAWWGSIYPEFCFSEWDQYGCDVEKFPSEQRRQRDVCCAMISHRLSLELQKMRYFGKGIS